MTTPKAPDDITQRRILNLEEDVRKIREGTLVEISAKLDKLERTVSEGFALMDSRVGSMESTLTDSMKGIRAVVDTILEVVKSKNVIAKVGLPPKAKTKEEDNKDEDKTE